MSPDMLDMCFFLVEGICWVMYVCFSIIRETFVWCFFKGIWKMTNLCLKGHDFVTNTPTLP